MRLLLLLLCCWLLTPGAAQAQVAKVTARGEQCGPRQCRPVLHQGSCFHIGHDDRLDYFLTVGHLLRGLSQPRVQISLDAGLQEAQVVTSSQEPDLALLALPRSADRQVFPLAQSVQIGQPLLCVGYSPGTNYRLSRGTLLRREASDHTLWTSCLADSGDSGGLIGSADSRTALGIIVWGPQAAGYDALFIRQWIAAQGIDLQDGTDPPTAPTPTEQIPVGPPAGGPPATIPPATIPPTTLPPAGPEEAPPVPAPASTANGTLLERLAQLLGVAVPVAGVLTGVAGTGGTAAVLIPLVQWYLRRRRGQRHNEPTAPADSAKTARWPESQRNNAIIEELRQVLQQATVTNSGAHSAAAPGVAAPPDEPAPGPTTPAPAAPAAGSPSAGTEHDRQPPHTCCQGSPASPAATEEGPASVASAPFPRALDEARELLAIRQSEGRVAVLDALRGMFFDDEYRKALHRADPQETSLLRQLQEAIDRRVSEVAPYSTTGF